MKRVHKELVAITLGAAGVVISLILHVAGLPPYLLTGFSAGVILATLEADVAARLLKPKSQEVSFPASQEVHVPKPQIVEPKPRDSETLDEFDRALSSMRRGAAAPGQVVESMDKAIAKLYAEYPEWEGEGRLRTYSVLKRISDLLDNDNAEPLMGMAFRMLKTRNDEAREYTRTLLNQRVEKMYHDPHFENSKYVAGTLIMMNRKEKEYIEQIVTDAIHLWSQPRFEALKPELSILRMLELEDRNSIAEMVMKEIVKGKMVKDVQVVSRGRSIIRMLSDHKRKARAVPMPPVPSAS